MARRSILFFCLSLSLVAHSALAFSWSDLWTRSDQQIDKLIESKSFDEAESRADSIEQQALIKYRAEAYESAAELYQQSEQDYNRATAMVRAGDYAGAIEAYDQVLADSPEYADAMHNRKIAQKLADLQDQQNGEGQQGDEQGEQKNDQSSGENPDDSQGQSSQQSGQSDQNSDPSDGNSGDGTDPEESEGDIDDSGGEPQNSPEEDEQSKTAEAGDKPHDEKQQAMDQWLQQVPDDPAGLLRARIIREHQRNYANSTDRAQAW